MGCSANKMSKKVRKSLKFISRYLSINPAEEAFSVLADYFGLALSFTTLGASIRRYHGRRRKLAVFTRKFQKAAVTFLAKRAMERLRGIASRASMLEKRSSTTAEQAELQRQLDEARVRRSEDAKANEKVMAMFSTQEQRWKSEQKRLQGLIETLRKELAECIRRLQAGRGKQAVDTSCLECKKKDLMINDLTGQLKEKDFLMAAANEDGDLEHSERCELAQKVATAEKMIETCEETLAAESKARKAAEAMVEVWEKQFAAEFEAHEAAVGNLKRKLAAEIETREAECEKLKEELEVQENVLTTVLGRTNSLKAENLELLEKMDSAANDNTISDRLRRFDVQAVQQKELQSYAEQVAELEKQVRYYQERVQQLEECALLRLDQFDIRIDGDEEMLHRNILSNSPTGTAAKDLHLNAAKHLLAQYIDAERARDLELSKWRKLYSAAKMAVSMVQTTNSYQVASNDSNIKQYIEAAKAQNAAELTDKHSHEIDSFERHMKAKDERMEGLRMHLLSLEQQLKARDSELKQMAGLLDAESAMRKEAESLMQETRQQLQTYLNESKRRRSKKEPELNDEAELYGKDLQLAFVEAKLVETQLQRNSRKQDFSKEKVRLEKEGRHQPSTSNAIAASSLELEKSTLQSDNQQLISRARIQDALETNRSEASTPATENTENANSEKVSKAKGLASILEKQLHEYHVLLQKINDLSAQAENAVKTGSISPASLLARARELQREVQSSGNNLSAIQASASFIAPSKDEEPSPTLKEHLAQIQKRIEMKIACLVGRFKS